LRQRWYCLSLTFSIHSTNLSVELFLNRDVVMAVVGVAPCQCFSPGENQTISPGRISLIGPPSR
jgi:hypothetical protein